MWNPERLIPGARDDGGVGTEGRDAQPAEPRASHRGVSELEIIGLDLAVLDRTAHPRYAKRTREVVTHVLLARPGHLDRASRLRFRQFDRLADIVVFEAPAKAAAGIQAMQLDVLGAESRDLSRHCNHEQRNLRSGPDVEPAILQLDHGIHRL